MKVDASIGCPTGPSILSNRTPTERCYGSMDWWKGTLEQTMFFSQKVCGGSWKFSLKPIRWMFLEWGYCSTKLKPLPPRCRHFVIRRIHGGGLFRGEGERRDLAHQCGPWLQVHGLGTDQFGILIGKDGGQSDVSAGWWFQSLNMCQMWYDSPVIRGKNPWTSSGTYWGIHLVGGKNHPTAKRHA